MCLCAVFSFMFPLVILDGPHPQEATPQTHSGIPQPGASVQAAIILASHVARYV